MSLIRFERNILAVRLQAMYKPDYNKGKKISNKSFREKEKTNQTRCGSIFHKPDTAWLNRIGE